MTDDESIKALEQIKRECVHRGSFYAVIMNAIDLINRQKAEIENYSHNNRTMTNSIYEMQKIIESQKAEIERLMKEKARVTEDAVKIIVAHKTAKTEAVKEFAERVKRYIDVGHLRPPTEICFSELDVVSMIDNLVKEMVGDTG